MAPRKALGSDGESIEDIKKTLDIMAGEMSTIKKLQVELMDLMNEVKRLRKVCDEKDSKINQLEIQLQQLEQNSIINDIVVTGIEVKPRNYARALGESDGGPQDEEDTKSVEEQVIAALHNKGIAINSDIIDNCYSIKKRNPSDKQVIILQMKDRKCKLSLLQQGKKLKGTNIYLNDHLIKCKSEIARKARELRRGGKIANTWTKDCKIFIKLNEPQGKVVLIRALDNLQQYM